MIWGIGMKSKKEFGKMIREAANEPEGSNYYKQIICELKSSSKTANISLIVAILSLLVAIMALVKSFI